MTLQENLDLLRKAGTPLPLTGMPEVVQAMRLRRAGLAYSALTTVMREYHGSTRTEHTWRNLLRSHGAPAKHYADGSRRVPPQLRGTDS
jgi:hypothetical protein